MIKCAFRYIIIILELLLCALALKVWNFTQYMTKQILFFIFTTFYNSYSFEKNNWLSPKRSILITILTNAEKCPNIKTNDPKTREKEPPFGNLFELITAACVSFTLRNRDVVLSLFFIKFFLSHAGASKVGSKRFVLFFYLFVWPLIVQDRNNNV